jgi:mitochondrial fission protein ELM1
MPDTATSWVLSEGLAGLQAQAIGLAEAAGLAPELRVLKPRAPWKYFPAKLWPQPLAAVSQAVSAPLPGIAIGCGGMAAAVLAALRKRSGPVVQVQHPRMDTRLYDLIVVNRHDELTGPNIIVTRNALHRVTPERLAKEAAIWRDRLASFKRPLVAVLVGGSNGRHRLGPSEGARFAQDLADIARRDNVGIVVTPSRRTDPAVTKLLRDALTPLGGWVWDFTGDNPYFGMLALADAIIVTMDSVSMVSEAAATAAPILLYPLPGRSRRISLFHEGMIADGRVRVFDGRFETWMVAPLNDTDAAAAEMRHRLGF